MEISSERIDDIPVKLQPKVSNPRQTLRNSGMAQTDGNSDRVLTKSL
ncbi:MAG: hypothetical protein PUP91_15480 [Rhizonema sp. PD37]|nr:hypothetical protein [Rhizonema sp. PD37]